MSTPQESWPDPRPGRRPFIVSGLVSLIGGAAGIVLLVFAGCAGAPRLALAALVLLVTAFLGGLVALVGEYVQRIYQLDRGLPFYELRAEDSKTEVGGKLADDG